MGWMNGRCSGQEPSSVVVSDCSWCVGVMMLKVRAFVVKQMGVIKIASSTNHEISDRGRMKVLAVSLPNNLYQAKKQQVARSLDGIEK